MSALDDLIESVEAGSVMPFHFREVFETPCQDIDLQAREEYARYAYKGSLDAALSLFNALLPGWGWMAGLPDGVPAGVVFPADDEDLGDQFYTESNTPARSLLLATLRAYRTQTEEGE